MAGERSVVERFATAPIMAGLFVGFGLMLATGMLVG
jgi:hypothetical protein